MRDRILSRIQQYGASSLAEVMSEFTPPEQADIYSHAPDDQRSAG